MGQRQSSQTSDSPDENEAPQSTPRTTRPPSRVQAQRDAIRSAVIPVNENQRRDERRARRERLRDHNTDAMYSSVSDALGESTSITPFSRMIASVISEAVLTSFRNGQMASLAPPTQEGNQENVRQQLTMHLSPELFQQMEPGSSEDSFMRFMRLPVIVSSVSTSSTTRDETTSNTTTAVNADGEPPTITDGDGQVTRIIMLPVFLYGIRSFNTPTSTTPPQTTDAFPPARRSERIRAAMAAATAAAAATSPSPPSSQTPTERTGSGQWTVYIISGNSVEGIMNDNPSYEELLDLATLIGPARLPTVSQEAIDNHVPIVKYTQQVKQTMVGNADGCQVCLSSYQSQDAVRILACHHGFHQECIDTWLTIGKNQCPLCRDVPIPTT